MPTKGFFLSSFFPLVGGSNCSEFEELTQTRHTWGVLPFFFALVPSVVSCFEGKARARPISLGFAVKLRPGSLRPSAATFGGPLTSRWAQVGEGRPCIPKLSG